MTPDANGEATIIPTLRYRDGRAAIDWFCNALGFKAHCEVPDKSVKSKNSRNKL